MTNSQINILRRAIRGHINNTENIDRKAVKELLEKYGAGYVMKLRDDKLQPFYADLIKLPLLNSSDNDKQQ